LPGYFQSFLRNERRNCLALSGLAESEIQTQVVDLGYLISPLWGLLIFLREASGVAEKIEVLRTL
jgi:hypothetical protein